MSADNFENSLNLNNLKKKLHSTKNLKKISSIQRVVVVQHFGCFQDILSIKIF